MFPELASGLLMTGLTKEAPANMSLMRLKCLEEFRAGQISLSPPHGFSIWLGWASLQHGGFTISCMLPASFRAQRWNKRFWNNSISEVDGREWYLSLVL